MALVVKDRVKETTTVTGTGTATLGGAASGYQSFSVVGDGNTTYYSIIDVENNDWEVGLGTYTASGTTLSRDTVLESSNAGSLVNFSAGTKTVFSTYPAEKAAFVDDIPASGVDFDPVGTDNSTDVTLAGSYDYITISGQVLTRNQVNASTDISGLATVATSGSYNDLSNRPTIPTNNNQLTNGAGYTTNVGDITGVTAGTNLTGGGSSGTVTLNVTASPSFTDVYVADQIFHTGDTNTYTQFHATDQWRVVTGGAERLEVNNSAVTIAGVLNVRNAIDLADNDILRFGSSDDCEFFCNGSHMYMDLNGGIGNFYIRDGTTTRYTFDDNGSFTATGNVTAYSDVRLKDEIEVIDDALAKVNQLRGVTFVRIDEEELGRQTGVIAQEVEAILPEVVLTADDDIGTKSVAYGNMVGLLIEAVKELTARVEDLEAKQ